MVMGFEIFLEYIGKENFSSLCDCILTDRGSEFSKPELFEKDTTGNKRCKVFYCDPMRSCQKARVEKEHTVLRYIVVKNKSFEDIGLLNQQDLNLVILYQEKNLMVNAH